MNCHSHLCIGDDSHILHHPIGPLHQMVVPTALLRLAVFTLCVHLAVFTFSFRLAILTVFPWLLFVCLLSGLTVSAFRSVDNFIIDNVLPSDSIVVLLGEVEEEGGGEVGLPPPHHQPRQILLDAGPIAVLEKVILEVTLHTRTFKNTI